jgi:hypothetical protein
MQNAGLPEAGDMVITLAADVVADPDAYAAAATLPAAEQTTTGTGAAARDRRDRAVATFVELRASVERGRTDELEAFHASAAALVAPQLDRWRAVLAAGPRAEVDRAERSLAALAGGDHTHLASASVHRLDPPPADAARRMGCCGTLGTFLP